MQQTNGMRLEKLELSNFAQFKEKQEIEFSKDDRVTIILGDNGSGKTTLLKAMRAGLGLEKQDEEHRQPQLKCNFDPAVINNENQFLFFNDIENLINIQDIDFLKFGMDSDFSEDVRTLFLKYIHKSSYLDIIYNSGKFEMVSDDGMRYNCPSTKEDLGLSICILIALKKRLFPNSFLVLDSPFGKISSRHGKEGLCQMLLEHISQLILLIPDLEYILDFEYDDKKVDSVKTIINNLNLTVSEYKLVTNKDQTKIKKWKWI